MTEQGILLPNGEWFKDLKRILQKAGLSLQQKSERNYSMMIRNLDLRAELVRTRDIPRLVDRADSCAVAGFTGTDVLINAGKRTLKTVDQDWAIPLIGDTNTPRSEVYLAYTPNAVREFGSSPTLEQILEGVHRHVLS